MNVASFIVVYVIAWWLILFMLLPIGVKRDDNPEEGNDIGAPVRHMIGKKALWATVLAGMVLLVYWVLVDIVGVTLVDLPGR